MLNSQLKVCVINPNYYRSSGVTKAIKSIQEGCLNTQFYFINCNYGAESNLDDIEWINKNRYYCLPLMRMDPFLLIPALFKLKLILKNEDINIIHVHHRRLSLILSLFFLFTDINIVYTGQLFYRFNPFFYFNFAKISTAISISVKKNIESSTMVNAVKLIPNPTYFIEKSQIVKPIEYKSVCCIGRFDEVKNHSVLIEAWSLLNPIENKFKLYLVGEGKLKDELVLMSQKLNIYQTISFVGYTDNVKQILSNCLFHTLPSLNEGQGIVNVEAASVGRASLVSNVPGSRDCVPSERGLPNLFDPKDVLTYANYLKIWLDQPDKVFDEGLLYYHFLKETCSVRMVGEKYEQVYRQLV